MYLSRLPEPVRDPRPELDDQFEPTLQRASPMAAADGEALRLNVRATGAVRKAALQALAKHKRRLGDTEGPARLAELNLAHAIAEKHADEALRRYAQYLSEAPDLTSHLRPR